MSSDRWWEFEEEEEGDELFASNLSKSTDPNYSEQDAVPIRHKPCLGLVSTKPRPHFVKVHLPNRNSKNATAPTLNPQLILEPSGKNDQKKELTAKSGSKEGNLHERAKAMVALRKIFPPSEDSDKKKKKTLAYNDIKADGEIRAPSFCSSQVKKLAVADKVHSWLQSETNSSPFDDSMSLSSIPLPPEVQVPVEILPEAAVESKPSDVRADVPPVPNTVQSVDCSPKLVDDALMESDVDLKEEPRRTVQSPSTTISTLPDVACNGLGPTKYAPIQSGPCFPRPGYAVPSMPSFVMAPPGHASPLPLNVMFANQTIAPRLVAPPGFFPSSLVASVWANGNRLNPNAFPSVGNVINGSQSRFAGNPGAPGAATFNREFDALENAKHVILFENLPTTISETTLRDLLKGFGNIVHIQITRKISSCSAYARVADWDVANWIVSTLNEGIVDGRALRVSIKK